jgi:hypothetical protein
VDLLLHPRIGIVNQADVGLSSPGAVRSGDNPGHGVDRGPEPVVFVMTAVVFPRWIHRSSSADERGDAIGNITQVTLPLAWPGIVAASIYVFADRLRGVRHSGGDRPVAAHHVLDVCFHQVSPNERAAVGDVNAERYHDRWLLRWAGVQRQTQAPNMPS